MTENKRCMGVNSSCELTAGSWLHGLITETRGCWEIIYTQVPTELRSVTIRHKVTVSESQSGPCREAEEVLSGALNMESQCGLRKG